jgi:hypothetical protein
MSRLNGRSLRLGFMLVGIGRGGGLAMGRGGWSRGLGRWLGGGKEVGVDCCLQGNK